MLKFVGPLLGAACLAVGSPASARWVEAKTDHFVIYTDAMSASEAAGYAQQIERFDELLRKIANVSGATDAPIDRVTIYVLPSVSDVRSLAHSRTIAGFYAAHAQGTLAVMPLSVPPEWHLSPSHVLFHEYTHHILLSSTEENYPSWVQEGLAEFFGTTTFKNDGSVILGAPPQVRGWALHRQYQMTLPELLGSDGKALNDEEVEDKYARGWLLTHYLLLGKKRDGQFDHYLRLVSKGVPSVEAGTAAFGDLNKLNAELDVYNRVGEFTTIAVPPSGTRARAVATRALSDCEEKIMPIRIKSAVGVDEKSAPKLVEPARAVASRCANDAFVERSLAEIEFDAKNNDQAMAAADRALQLDPGNVMAMVYKGRVFARQGKWADARAWYAKANHAKPDYALPLMLYYDTFMRAGESPPQAAVNGLFRAIMLVPQDDSLRLRVAYALIRQGELATARSVLAPIAFSAHADKKNPALDVLNKIDAHADAAAVLAEADKAKWKELGKE